TSIVFGTGALGAVVADFDSIALESRVPGGAWAPVAIQDPGFEGVWVGGWMTAGNSKRAVVTRPSDQAPEGKHFLRVAAPPDVVSTTELYPAGAPISGASIDIDLGTGLKARVPLALSDADASANAANPALRGLQSALAALPEAPPSTDLDTRLADTVVAWNVFRHFYPYWKEAGVDWNARLVPLLDDARKAATREQHRDALRRLVAEIGDGHGSVNDRRNTSPRTTVPIQLRVVEKRVVVTASAAPADVPVGAVLTTIGRVPAEKRLDDLTQLASGTPQWRQTRALNEMIVCTQGSPVTLTVDAGAGPRSATLPCGGTQPTDEKRPDPVSELRPGIWYVDLTRARAQQLTAAIGTLSGGRGVVFDVRGYPTDAGAAILPHLIGAAEQDRWMHVGKLVGPNFDVAAWEDLGWNVQPASPRIGGRAVFLTDGRAISYAESVMGYVADRKLGTIIGAPTAGANGNVAVFPVPGGFTIAFTGMRVTRHDGSSPHHLVGIQPDIPLAPTIAAIRAGRDELIERAISVIEQK
ncbi:MAG TPA: S41 family peptidase, partial [Vicinamibacterales bacterium]|nr:S41 family peptidase [Vicinamibacterales bacterium]